MLSPVIFNRVFTNIFLSKIRFEFVFHCTFNTIERNSFLAMLFVDIIWTCFTTSKRTFDQNYSFYVNDASTNSYHGTTCSGTTMLDTRRCRAKFRNVQQFSELFVYNSFVKFYSNVCCLSLTAIINIWRWNNVRFKWKFNLSANVSSRHWTFQIFRQWSCSNQFLEWFHSWYDTWTSAIVQSNRVSMNRHHHIVVCQRLETCVRYSSMSNHWQEKENCNRCIRWSHSAWLLWAVRLPKKKSLKLQKIKSLFIASFRYITAAIDWCRWIENEQRIENERQLAAKIQDELFRIKLYRNRMEIDQYQKSSISNRFESTNRSPEYYSPDDIQTILQRTAKFTRS